MSNREGKIFGIGLSRTGTASLNEALRLLGFNVVHYPDDDITYKELAEGRYRLSILSEYDGITDIVAAPFYPQFDEVYPGSKFILTTREEHSWLESMKHHWKGRSVTDKSLDTDSRTKAMRFYRASAYGAYEFSHERMRFVGNRHFKNVHEYFQDRPNSLQVLDIVAGEGWEKLAPFLNKSIPSVSFPRVNFR